MNFLNEAYTSFISRYPESRYRQYIDSVTSSYFASVKSTLTAGIFFDSPNSAYKSFEEILKKHRGQVIYIDLWGTWCGPCKEEFNYTRDLKEYFKSKPVDFLYIAFENSTEPEKLWKETATFYNLAGRHILANKELRGEIERMYASHGLLVFPSYILVDKKGRINTLSARRPSSKHALYKQIDQLLNNEF